MKKILVVMLFYHDARRCIGSATDCFLPLDLKRSLYVMLIIFLPWPVVIFGQKTTITTK